MKPVPSNTTTRSKLFKRLITLALVLPFSATTRPRLSKIWWLWELCWPINITARHGLSQSCMTSALVLHTFCVLLIVYPFFGCEVNDRQKTLHWWSNDWEYWGIQWMSKNSGIAVDRYNRGKLLWPRKTATGNQRNCGWPNNWFQRTNGWMPSVYSSWRQPITFLSCKNIPYRIYTGYLLCLTSTTSSKSYLLGCNRDAMGPTRW